jgi:hypothetical protein
MKKIALAILILLTLTLAACGTASSGTTSVASNSSAATLPVQTKLILGIFKLEGTTNAVSAEQAVALLPLWHVYQDLSVSDAAAQAEITALIEQIQLTLTSPQLAAIDSMGLTQQDILSVMIEKNIAETSQQQTTASQSNSAAPQGGPGGGMPGGGPGGDLLGGVTTTASSTQTTAVPPTQSQNSATALLDALIQLLQNKAA